jgi:C4-dicarboxylate transporter DctM subunit
LTKVVHSTTANPVLMSIPMFVLMSEFLASSGAAEDLLLSCNRMLRKVRGGLAMACILAGVVHAAATGSSSASAASLARASFPAMTKAGYAPSFSAGTIAIAGTLAIMVPPSVAFILFGLMTETSIGKLFIAGIIPGVLTALGYIVSISVTLWLRPDLGPSPSREEAAASYAPDGRKGAVWPMLLLIAIVLGGLYLGVATPTEIAALGALGAFLLAVQARRMGQHEFVEAVGGTMRITSMVIAIIFGAHIFGYYVSFSHVTDTLLAWIGASGLSPTAVMLCLVLLYLIMGMVMDQAAILILTAPISTALMVGLGYDPIWWGVIIIKTAEIGMISPPVGIVTFVTSSATKVDLKSCFRGVTPYAITELILLAILVAFPALSTWLPSL